MVLQMQTHQLVASVGDPGTGQFREELRRAKAAIPTSITAHRFPAARTLLRGPDGSGAIIAAVAECTSVPHGNDYSMFDRPDVPARLHVPADQHLNRAESGVSPVLSNCPDQRLSENGPLVRAIVATHPAPTKKTKKRPVGVIRDGVVDELFWTHLPQRAFTASDVVSLALHRGAFETAREEEDNGLEPDRWCSHCAWGQEAWRIVAQ
jgi:hypothetical protein